MKRFACPGVAALRAVAWAVGLMTGSFAAAPAQAITYELVPVGNPGNAHDVYGYGGVDAARFANWMSNGQPAGGQTGATTENGAYELNGATTGDAVARNAVNPNTGAAPSFFIPLAPAAMPSLPPVATRLLTT